MFYNNFDPEEMNRHVTIFPKVITARVVPYSISNFEFTMSEMVGTYPEKMFQLSINRFVDLLERRRTLGVSQLVDRVKIYTSLNSAQARGFVDCLDYLDIVCNCEGSAFKFDDNCEIVCLKCGQGPSPTKSIYAYRKKVVEELQRAQEDLEVSSE